MHGQLPKSVTDLEMRLESRVSQLTRREVEWEPPLFLRVTLARGDISLKLA